MTNFGDKINTNGFKSNPNNINKNGAPKKIYTILKEKGYSKSDVKTAFGELSFYSLKELKEVQNDNSKPIIVRIVSKQFIAAFEDGDWNKIREILEHSIGKAQQSIEQKINIETEKPLFNINLDDV